MSTYDGPAYHKQTKQRDPNQKQVKTFQNEVKGQSFSKRQPDLSNGNYQPSYQANGSRPTRSFEALANRKQAHDEQAASLHYPHYQVPYLKIRQIEIGNQALMAERMESDQVEIDEIDPNQYHLDALFQRVDQVGREKQAQEHLKTRPLPAMDWQTVQQMSQVKLGQENLENQILVKSPMQGVELTRYNRTGKIETPRSSKQPRQVMDESLLNQHSFHQRMSKPIDSYILFMQEDLT